MEPRVVDNPKESRYELWLGDTRAGFIDYLSEPGTVLLVHTEVDPALEGQGLGARLVAGALADLRARGLKLVPCARSSAPTYAATPRTPTWSAAAGASPNDQVDAAGGQGRRPTRTSHVILRRTTPASDPLWRYRRTLARRTLASRDDRGVVQSSTAAATTRPPCWRHWHHEGDQKPRRSLTMIAVTRPGVTTLLMTRMLFTPLGIP